ncbi:exopolysaccharide biosynthesis protein [Yangia sp. PrR004]|nr:exopolysaccharide biosynthesis protein [Salipiger sp. PrR004]
MTEATSQQLSDLLNDLESLTAAESVRVQDVVDKLGARSFASLMLIFSLISASPASAIPGLTALVAVIVGILVVQMIFGRRSVWLPQIITKRHMSSEKLRKGLGWLRKPVKFVEKFLKPRLTFLCHRPWLLLPLALILGLTIFMPLMEIVPTSGSIASAAIALFAAGLLSRDGGLILLSLLPLLAVPVVVFQASIGL